MCRADSDREDSATESKPSVLVVPPKQMSSALGSLLANYGSMSESDSGDEPEGKFAPNVNKSSSAHLDAHNPTTGFFSSSHLNPKDQRSSPRKSGSPAFSARDQQQHGPLYTHHPLVREGRHTSISPAKFGSEHKRWKRQRQERR